MSDLAHVPGQRIELRAGRSLAEVFESALKRGVAEGAPPASKPLRDDCVRSPSELQVVIDEARIGYEDCGRLSVSLDWWNRNSSDPAWELAVKGRPPVTG
ncbi:MAG TPA: hypothetical protein VGF76_16805 [Polyangiaceae bacterium]